jgi:uncharacterized protein YmfQ (DUF2313 family)
MTAQTRQYILPGVGAVSENAPPRGFILPGFGAITSTAIIPPIAVIAATLPLPIAAASGRAGRTAAGAVTLPLPVSAAAVLAGRTAHAAPPALPLPSVILWADGTATPTLPIFNTPTYSQADYLAGFQGLLPTGFVWPRESDAVLTQALNALMPTYVRQGESSAALLQDCFPPTAVFLLPEWEATLGLPDPCTALGATLQQRQAAVLAKLIATGGQSVPYFIAFALALGFAITITEFWPFCADDDCELPDCDPSWAFAWQVNAPQITTFYFSADESFADDLLETYDAGELICRMTRYKPAQTLLFFVFS